MKTKHNTKLLRYQNYQIQNTNENKYKIQTNGFKWKLLNTNTKTISKYQC